MSKVYTPTQQTPVSVYDHKLKQAQWASDEVAVEVPVALVYNYISHAVMMATPTDLEDFAVGFSLTEEIVQTVDEIDHIHVHYGEQGITVRLQINDERFEALKSRRRNLVGRTGCGLCGAETLKQAIRPVMPVKAPKVSHDAINLALESIRSQQQLNQSTGATHAVAWCDLTGQIIDIREDVGRHNALDKLVGHLARNTINTESGFVLVTSRASYEMVQKSCFAGIGCLVAISAPTSLAIELAQQAGLLLIGFARAHKQVIYNTPHQPELLDHVI